MLHFAIRSPQNEYAYIIHAHTQPHAHSHPLSHSPTHLTKEASKGWKNQPTTHPRNAIFMFHTVWILISSLAIRSFVCLNVLLRHRHSCLFLGFVSMWVCVIEFSHLSAHQAISSTVPLCHPFTSLPGKNVPFSKFVIYSYIYHVSIMCPHINQQFSIFFCMLKVSNVVAYCVCLCV